jgi:hypothetical protein
MSDIIRKESGERGNLPNGMYREIQVEKILEQQGRMGLGWNHKLEEENYGVGVCHSAVKVACIHVDPHMYALHLMPCLC